jgi:hypothetical protein
MNLGLQPSFEISSIPLGSQNYIDGMH